MKIKAKKNLNVQFNFNIKKLINNYLIYINKGNETQNNDEINKNEEKKWELSKENYQKNKIYFILNDFKLAEEEEKINVKFLLIYNNIQNSTNNSYDKNNIILFHLILFNYYYIIMLIQNNYGYSRINKKR